jgi:hypothetical protein
MAYMTAKELSNHILSVTMQNTNTVRHEILKAIFNSAADTFVDPLWGSLTIQPLANGDSVVYPPVEGAIAEATEDHYLESGYTAASISDTNNPFVVIRQDLEHHFGIPQGANANIAVFINTAEVPETMALAEFEEVPEKFLQPGANVTVPQGMPGNVPGRVIGRVSGCWAVEWSWIPAAWAFGTYLDAPRPLIRRVDPADTGLGTGLQLVAKDAAFPFNESFWRSRFGFGVGNRLNGVCMEFGTGGTYTVPSAYQ